MPPRDNDESPEPSNTIYLILSIIGLVIICICINSVLNNDSNESVIPQVPSDQLTTSTPTTTVTETPYFVMPPTSYPQTYLNYTFNSLPYRMGVPLDSNLENTYMTHETMYVCTKYGDDTSPCSHEETEEYYIRYVTDEAQDTVISNIVNTIQHQTSNTDDQARIAISMVQHIPYDSVKAETLTDDSTMRYPYQVIYEGKGLCSEKSLLLAALLKKLGYGVSLFHFESENHMALGIKSPSEYAYAGSEYAFIETTTPSIPTDALGSYSGEKLTSTPNVYIISDGRSMDSIYEEYNDNVRFQQISLMGNELPTDYYYEWKNFTTKYGMTVE